MFNCNKCRQTFDGDPSMRSGKDSTILWCRLCSEEWKESSRVALQKRFESIAARNRCLWCDDPLTDQNRFKPKNKDNNSNMCVRCDSHSTERQWLEKCASNSPTIVKYMSDEKRQEKWKKAREAKEALQQPLPIVANLDSWSVASAAAQLIKSTDQSSQQQVVASLLAQLMDALNPKK